MVKVRFAPSPTGALHVGGIRTALFNYFFARSSGGSFVLRNEDTDQARKVEGSLDKTLESLTWLGVTWDGLVTQSQRLEEYSKYASELIEKGFAKEEEGAIRFIVDKTHDREIKWTDRIGNKEISYKASSIEDFIILKKDGFPTYHLANVVDDHLMEITHVIRGEDWIPSAPKHILLYEAFEWQAPVFAHVPNVLGTDGKKLSKRRGAKSVLDFKSEGYLAEALLNYLMLLGWSPKNDQEILSKEEIEKTFTLENINVSPAIFDERKLLWMNGEYIRKTQNSELKRLILEFDPELQEYDQGFLEKLIEPAKTRIKTLAEFRGLALPFIVPVSSKTPLLALYSEKLNNISVNLWNKETIMGETIAFMKDQNIRYPQIYNDLTGDKQGLPLGEVFEILGKQKTLELLK